MKKRIYLVIFMFAANAYANVDYSDGAYIKFQAGYSYQQIKEAGQDSLGSSTILAGVGLGYDFITSYKVPLRAEILYGYRTNNSNQYLSTDSTLNAKIDTLVLNVYYDFYNKTDFTPYIVGGLGVAFPRVYLNSRSGDVITDDFGFDGKKLTGNIGAGVTYKIDNNFFSNVGLMYSRVGNFTATDASVSHNINYMQSVDLILGVSYRF